MASDLFVDHTRRDFMRVAGSGLAVLAVSARPDMAVAQTAGSPLKIGMVGAGREGGALGRLFVKAGHPVMLSSRNPEGLKGLVAGLGEQKPVAEQPREQTDAGALDKVPVLRDQDLLDGIRVVEEQPPPGPEAHGHDVAVLARARGIEAELIAREGRSTSE